MRLGADSVNLPPFPRGPIPKEAPPPDTHWSLFTSKRQPQLPSIAWAHCLGGKALLAGCPPRMGLEAPGEAHPPTHTHTPACH